MKPPKKGAGELSHAPAIEPQAPRRYVGCSHGATRVEFCPPSSYHYAKAICTQCGRFVDWLPKPSNVMRRKMNVYRLGVLARAARLNNWEQNFVRDVAEERRLSPRQQAKLNEIWSVHQEEVSS